MKNEKPILFDEWQDAPKICGTISKDCDDNPEAFGEYYLTGSSSKKIDTPHTGTGRISEIRRSFLHYLSWRMAKMPRNKRRRC